MMVTVRSHSFKRLIIGLSPGSAGHSARLAVELAGLLELELLGLFLDDSNLRNLAGIPFAREFRPLSGGWRPMSADEIERTLDVAARNAERAFAQVAERLAARHHFEVLRGSVGEALAALSQTNDIVMIVEPVSAAERASQQFTWLTEAAFRSSAAVLLVPIRSARGTGPIVAIAARPDDPSIRTAAAIATAAKEPLIVVQAHEGQDDAELLRGLSAENGLTIRVERAGPAILSDPDVCRNALAQVFERLIVLSRTATTHEFAPALVAARRVPVLVLEPEPND
jgi:hypothetical protein